jgi:hypothetical protein
VNDSELLALVADERRRSIGFDHDETLRSERQKALNYYKGDMPDVPSMAGRSKAVSTDVAEAIDTVLPDLVEIFTGEEVVAFLPKGEEDEEAAEQETDYINHVFFNENPGFLILHTAMKDSLLTKTGVITWWAEDYEEVERFEGKTQEEAQAAIAQHGDAVEVEAGEEGLFNLTIRRKGKKPCVAAVPSEDFTVSRDTIRLTDTPYCAMRSRPRAMDLVALGIDPDLVSRLPAYGRDDEEIDLARDTVGEHNEADAGGIGEHRQVEVHNHYVKTKDGYQRVMTDASESLILEREDVVAPRFAAITPYLVPHRFYGESVADKLLEIQRIKTALTRMALDSGYFALNQRMEVNMDRATDWTISDLLRNEPNVPVRTKGEAIRPLTSGGLSFDAFGALEYFSVQGEQRTGIVRNAQGLNPDTLHDTAKGAMALMTAAQKRVRMIARVFAETGLKDMFLGLHALIRETASGPLKARLRNRWVEIDPTSWGSRSDMTIEIGVGAAGKEAQAIMLQQGLEVMREVIAMQGGTNGPFVTADNAYAFLKRYLEKGLDFKSADPYLTDPASLPPQEPQPDPAMMEAQAKLQLQEQESQGKLALEQAKAEAGVQMSVQKARADLMLAREKQQAELQQRAAEHAADLQLRQAIATDELMLRREEMAMEFELKREANRLNAEAKAQTSVQGPQQGGTPG